MGELVAKGTPRGGPHSLLTIKFAEIRSREEISNFDANPGTQPSFACKYPPISREALATSYHREVAYSVGVGGVPTNSCEGAE